VSTAVEQRIARLEGSYEQIRDRLNSIDSRLTSIDGRFGQIDARFAHFEQRLDSRFAWLLGIVVTSWVTTILTILFHR
jgi:hypothetical protein